LLLGVPLALVTGSALGYGAENVIHMVLGASFLLLAFAVFDFRLPTWINLPACAATGALAAIFLLQGASDLTHSASLQGVLKLFYLPLFIWLLLEGAKARHEQAPRAAVICNP
jgi:hypothetical protein